MDGSQSYVCSVVNGSLDQVPRGPSGTFHRTHSSTHATKKKELQVLRNVGDRDVGDTVLPRLSVVVGATSHRQQWLPAPASKGLCVSCFLFPGPLLLCPAVPRKTLSLSGACPPLEAQRSYHPP